MKIYENLDINDLENEIWKTIDGYPDYSVSNLGRVKSLKFGKEKILKQIKDGEYFIINLSVKNKKYKRTIHRLVFETFNDYKLESYECVHHKNESKKNNYYKNLEKMTIKNHNSINNLGKVASIETKIKMSKNQPVKKGEKNSNHKLKNGEVWLIKKILNSDYYKSGKINQTFIGKMFKVNRQTISDIKCGKTWSHIKI